ncbi:unnamed protein product [Penicillium olsonii]|nr:unnamed protein product [Penicillium olsonii]
MRSHGQQISDRLTVEVDCHSLGPSECPSMTSSFSPLDSPTPTPTSIYSQGSMASPGWPESGQYHHSMPMERRTSQTPLRSAFKMADLTSNDGMMNMPCGNMDRQEQIPLPEYLPGYDDNVDQLWLPQDVPKTYQESQFPYQAQMPQYSQMARNYYHRPQQAGYLPESASNPCLSRPIFNQSTDRMPNSASMSNMFPWMPSQEMVPQTITPSQAMHSPMTPPHSSYSEFPTHIPTYKAHTPSTPHRSVSMGTPSGSDTPISRMSHGEYPDEFQLSPVYRDGLIQRHRQPSRKPSKKQLLRSTLSLENLPPIIKQVQFKCKEPGCKGRFKRQEHLKRHMKSHSKEKPHVCWVPGCHRAFSRSDNLNAHYTKTHSKRGGRNRYVATLDETSPDFDPDFRGQLTADGRPMYGTKLEDAIPDCGELSVDGWDD